MGVNLLFHLTKIAAETLGEPFDQEVIEMHHHHKIDSPSGTARRLGEILAQAAGGTYEEMVRNGRAGDVGARSKKEIGMHALRGGDVVGDHTVVLAGPGERVELTHKASSRDTFAGGALRAASWIRTQRPGLYSMQDVLWVWEEVGSAICSTATRAGTGAGPNCHLLRVSESGNSGHPSRRPCA